MISTRAVALQGIGTAAALMVAVQGLAPVSAEVPGRLIYGAPNNPHERTTPLAQIASDPWRESALLERAYREDEELLQIVEELVRHIQ